MVETEEIWVEKYRPRKLSEVIGQREIVNRIQTFVEKRSLPNMLFAGPAGCGKTTVALCTARELFGENWRQNLLELNASVTPDTPIMVRENGVVKRTDFADLAKRYFRTDSQKYARVENLEVLSIDKDYGIRFLPVSLISRHKVDEIVRIEYEGGWISTSLDHSVMVISDSGLLESKRACELKKANHLVTFKKGFNEKSRIPDYTKNSKAEIIFDQEVDEDLAWLFGLYLTEGHASLRNGSGRIVFTLPYPHGMDSLGKLEKTFLEKFGSGGKSKIILVGSEPQSMKAFQYRVTNARFAKLFRKHFHDNPGSENAMTRRVPNFIYSASSSVKKAFLEGCVEDVHGGWGKRIRHSLNPKRDLIDIAWLERMSDPGVPHFAGVRAMRMTFGHSCTESLPAQPIENFTKKLRVPNDRFPFHSDKRKTSKRFSEKRIMGKRGSSVADNIKKLIDSGISVVLIKNVEIEKYDGYVYDFSVPGSEMFFGGVTPVLLHNSDERGIDTIRTKVKDYARTRPIGDVPYKIVLLDESDALTPDAQQALRRTMEMYTHTCRFILDCNISSRIIEPIQSRCSIFRFKRLSDEEISQMLKRIARNEKLSLTDNGIKAIIHVSEGDMRRAINVLQAAAASRRKVDERIVYEISTKARPEEIRQMLDLAIAGKFVEAREKLYHLLIDRGLGGEDILEQVHREIFNLDLPESTKIELIDKVGEFDFRLTEGANERIQLEAMLAHFSLVGKSKFRF